jgi:hypothetical protein
MQGDQIGRIFAQWATVCFRQFPKNDTKSPQFWASFSKILILTKNGLRYILGDFFTNSSGHPGPMQKAGNAAD